MAGGIAYDHLSHTMAAAYDLIHEHGKENAFAEDLLKIWSGDVTPLEGRTPKEYFLDKFKELNSGKNPELRQQWNDVEGMAGGHLREIAWLSAYVLDSELIDRLYTARRIGQKNEVTVAEDKESVSVRDSYGVATGYRHVHGWTHDDPALLYCNTEISVYFYDSEKNTVENIDNVAGIDAYEDRKGFFLVREDEYDEAYRQLEAHDAEQRVHDMMSQKPASISINEANLISQYVMDQATGNHLLGRERPEGYFALLSEMTAAHEHVMDMQPVTDRERDLLITESLMYQGGVSELADELNVDKDYLASLLPVKAVVKENEAVRYSEIEDIEHRPISSVIVTVLNLPEQRMTVALNSYNGCVHELDVKAGIIQGGLLTFADGSTTDLDNMSGHSLEEELGKTLADQIESMDMSDTVEHPIIDNGASIWDFYAEQIGLGLGSELRDKLNGLIPESGNRLVLDVPISTTLLGKEFGERNIVGFANNNGYFSAQTDKGENADIDRLVISGLVASHKQIDGQHYTCEVKELREEKEIMDILKEYPTIKETDRYRLDISRPMFLHYKDDAYGITRYSRFNYVQLKDGVISVHIPGTVADYSNLTSEDKKNLVVFVKEQHEGLKDGNPIAYVDDFDKHLIDLDNFSFNKELERYIAGNMKKSEMLHLGYPVGVMKGFLPDLPIVVRQSVLHKGSEKKHDINLEALHDMPERISSPIFVFKRDNQSLGILTEMKDRQGLNVCVAIALAKEIQDGKEILVVNDLRSIHGRNVEDVLFPIIQNNSLRWVDKEKGLAWFSSASQYVQQEITKQDLDSAAKIVKDFDNRKYFGKNLLDVGENNEIREEKKSFVLHEIDGIDTHPMEKIVVTMLNLPEQRITVDLYGYDGSVHGLDVVDGVVKSGKLIRD